MRDSLNRISRNFAAAIVPVWLLESTFLLPLAAAALFIIGLITIRKEATQSHGLDRVIPFGRLFFAVSLAVFGMQHFVLFDSVKFAVQRGCQGAFSGPILWALP